MKKSLTLILIFALIISALFAGDREDFKNEFDSTPAAYSGIGSGFKHADPEILGMGGAGVALMNSSHAFILNPASIAEGRFRLSFPSVTFTLYHPYDFVKKDSNGKTLLDKALNISDASESEKTQLISEALTILGTQFSPLLRVDATTGVIIPIGRFAFGVNVSASDTVYTYSKSVIDEVNSEVALGLGYNFKLGDFALAVGLDGKFSALAFNKRIKATELSNIDNGITIAVASGAAGVFDIGTTLQYKSWSFGVALREINFTGYKMSIDTAELTDVAGKILEFGDGNDITVKTTPNLTMGFGYTLEAKLFDLKVAFDFTDIVSLAQYSDSSPGKALFKHLNAGIDFGFVDTIYLRAGVNSGYYTAGMTLDIFALRMEAAYYWKEMGAIAGQRGLDGLTIRFNIGYER